MRFAGRVAQSVFFIIDRARSLPAIARMKARDLVVFNATSRVAPRIARDRNDEIIAPRDERNHRRLRRSRLGTVRMRKVRRIADEGVVRRQCVRNGTKPRGISASRRERTRCER
jgi:hypothetical protein